MVEKTVNRLLAIKPYSTTELKKKLLSKKFPLKEIEAVIQKYCEWGYLNDEDLGKRRAEYYKKKGYGPRWIQAKLKEQGLFLNEYPKEEQIQFLKDFLKKPSFQTKNRNNQIGLLQRRGFDLDLIFEVLRYNHF